jgi:2-keto-4-pentenoate hydratase/2-oxohepta-3-ene-1,7-dioic acid hydratase in catechol pathway
MNFIIPEFPDLQFGTLFCIGRNYAKHAAEMKSDLPEEPVVFLKPRSSLVFDNSPILLPDRSGDVHHEVELVVLIGSELKNADQIEAKKAIRAIGIGLDLTARDIQADAKKKGLPWSLAKGFDTFAPLGNLVPFNGQTDLQNLSLKILINNEIRQDGNTKDMIFPVTEILSYLSHQFTLNPGDLIFTGTPEGVGPVYRGDKIFASLQNDLSILEIDVQG